MITAMEVMIAMIMVKVIMFKLELWEAGSGITGRFENLEQMDNPDAVVFIFSSLDRNSFDSLPDLIQQINSEGK